MTLTPNLPMAQQPQEVQDVAASEEYRRDNAMDYELLRLVNRRLDTEIARRGASFQRELETFRLMKRKAQSTCGADESAVRLCYVRDEGTGQHVRKFGVWVLAGLTALRTRWKDVDTLAWPS